MEYNFDEVIDRKNTDSFKWDMNKEYFGREDVLPMWVADMDFACAPPIVRAVCERAGHPIYGYTVRKDDYYEAVRQWFKKRHHFDCPAEWLVFSPPGVIYAVWIMLNILTEPGDKIAALTPNYAPLFDAAVQSGRKLVTAAMKIKDGRYTIDFAKTEEVLADHVKIFILSNPNNPTGRVYTKEELSAIENLCEKYGVYVIADEIYSDFILPGHEHIPFASLSRKSAENSMCCYATNKGFNLGGLAMSTIVIADTNKRKAFEKVMMTAQTRLDNIFGAEALKAAYTEGGPWLDAVVAYVDENKKYVSDFLKNNLPQIELIDSEGTFLLWLDMRKIASDGKVLEQFLTEKAGLALTQGYEFGKDGEGFVRMNIACPRATVKKAMERLKTACTAP